MKERDWGPIASTYVTSSEQRAMGLRPPLNMVPRQRSFFFWLWFIFRRPLYELELQDDGRQTAILSPLSRQLVGAWRAWRRNTSQVKAWKASRRS